MGLRGAPLAAVGVDIVVVTCSHRSLAMLSLLEEVQLGARTGDIRETSARVEVLKNKRRRVTVAYSIYTPIATKTNDSQCNEHASVLLLQYSWPHSWLTSFKFTTEI